MIYNAAIYPSGFFVSRVNAHFRAGAALGRRPYPYKRNPSCLIEVPSILMDHPQPVNSDVRRGREGVVATGDPPKVVTLGWATKSLSAPRRGADRYAG